MNFPSFGFILFFLVVLLVTRVFLWHKPAAKKNFLLFASYYFYMSWDWRFGGLILLITTINYVIGPRIFNANSPRKKKAWLALSVALSLLILGYFKYMNFFIESANALLTSIGFSGELPLLSIILPVGISFYTFQSISYTLDIYRERIKPVANFRDFALFVAFFPQLVAGPIVRASFFLPQLENDHRPEKDEAEAGFALIIRGFIKKIAMADILALHIVDPAFENPALYSPLFLLIAIYAYSYQVYMDFSGYTDIARGVAKTLGYELQINFNRPYKSLSISNFWQRWHISMSSFFRDYLYHGVGGSKHGNVYINLLITFIAIGIWHGAGWNFILYGMIHGMLVGFERWQRQRRKSRGINEPEYKGIKYVFRILLVFNIVAFSRLLFRGGSAQSAYDYAASMTNFQNTYLPLTAISLFVLFTAVVLHYTPSRWTFTWKDLYCRLPAPIQAILIVVVTFALIGLSVDEAPFIYFQF